MALIAVSGTPGSGHADLARLGAQLLGCELVTEKELGAPETGYVEASAIFLANLATKGHAVLCAVGAELLAKPFPLVLRIQVVAPESVRVKAVGSKAVLHRMESEQAAFRKSRFGQKLPHPTDFDLTLNAQKLSTNEMAAAVESVVRSLGLLESAPLSVEAAAQIQFNARVRMARLGMAPAGELESREFKHSFGHPSEQVFARLLDFYGIAWDYEPRSFPLQWDKDGKVAEAFTPDFYLPEFDLYVELTTMKQAHVTKKNRKIRLLRSIYPHVNIQVFYQKDVQDLVMKYGLPERLAR
jgi:hypoxanthine phosphoribosyltransferase